MNLLGMIGSKRHAETGTSKCGPRIADETCQGLSSLILEAECEKIALHTILATKGTKDQVRVL